MSTESTKTLGETVDTLTLNFKELEIKHKKERKDLQASIMQLKKAVPKVTTITIATMICISYKIIMHPLDHTFLF